MSNETNQNRQNLKNNLTTSRNLINNFVTDPDVPQPEREELETIRDLINDYLD